ncbi:Lar family restriction alleviation protein [Burkholderia multivorans]|uniref:Lar family restriction alleviation protein n=1 Tax=Burkholderia multivorans TaxID=87883 RepID=UPI0011B22B2F|nr:Lar family restriction alleviation protein [Burkholderia multivorans]
MTTTDKSRADAPVDLLPCPFCGHGAHITTGDGPFFGRAQVECRSCRIATYWYDDALVVRQWNRRVATSANETGAEGATWHGLTDAEKGAVAVRIALYDTVPTEVLDTILDGIESVLRERNHRAAMTARAPAEDLVNRIQRVWMNIAKVIGKTARAGENE